MKILLYSGIIAFFLMTFNCGKLDEQAIEEKPSLAEESDSDEEIDDEKVAIDEEDRQGYGRGIEESDDAISAIAKEQMNDLFKTMKRGNIVFNVPDSMKLNETRGIHLVLSATKTVSQLEQQIQEGGSLRNRSIRISRIMVANLKGAGFEINPITEPMQVVDMNADTEWRWEITAIQPGTRNLYLTMDAIITIDGKEKPHTIHSLSEEIMVHVSIQQHISAFVAKNWQWLWSAILVPLIGWLWERRKKQSA